MPRKYQNQQAEEHSIITDWILESYEMGVLDEKEAAHRLAMHIFGKTLRPEILDDEDK